MQIDPVEYNRLINTINKQEKEIRRLKNLLDFEEPKVSTSKHKKNINLDDPLEKWNCQHFIRYFRRLYKKAYDKEYMMQPSAYKLEAFKITHFWGRHKDLTKEQFKEFITWLFATANENYKIKMGLMTTDNQLENFKKSATKSEKDEYNIKETEKKLEDIADELPEADTTGEELKDKLRKTLGEK